MTDTFISVNDQRVVRAVLTVGNGGPWFMDLDLEDDPELSGAVVVKIGAQEFRGTIDSANTGRFGLQTRCRVVAGANGWKMSVPAKDYHSDNGVRALVIAQDAARAVGEELGTFAPRSERIGIDYARTEGPASRVLNDVVGDVAWYVDYAGKTNVGRPPDQASDPTLYQVVTYDPRERIVQLKILDIAAIQVGSIITQDLDTPQTVRSFELVVSAEGMQAMAWVGGDEQSVDRLAGLIQAISRGVTKESFFGIYKYRVVKMSADRVEMQVVRKGTGLPDLLPVSMWPGVAGVHAQLTPSAEVLVQFIDGDKTQPIVTHFAGKDGIGFAPVSLVLGGPTGPAAARVGDPVEVELPPATFTGTIGGSPASGTVVFDPPAKAFGTITAGSTKVSIA